MSGWVKLHRSMLDWEWYDDLNVWRLFTHLILTVNCKEKKWKGIKIMPGQIITGRIKLSEETGLSEREIRTALTKLKSTNEITIKSTSKYSILTIVNWEKYQTEESKSTNKLSSKKSNERPASDQQATTIKERIDYNNNSITAYDARNFKLLIPGKGHEEKQAEEKKELSKDGFDIRIFLSKLDFDLIRVIAPEKPEDEWIRIYNNWVKSPGKHIPTKNPSKAFTEWLKNISNYKDMVKQ